MGIERQIQKFYAKWSPRVLAFCCVLLGKGADAERTTVEAFQAYLSRGLDLDVVQAPSLLFVFALDAAKGASSTTPQTTTGVQRLEEAVILLPWKERSVFALRSALHLDDMVISEIAEIPVQEVRRFWMKALVLLRGLLQKDFFSGRKI